MYGAHTFGTEDDAYIVLNGMLVDHLNENELMSVIGHECGHIQNNHVVFSTALLVTHVPAVYGLALRSDTFHEAEHALYLAAAAPTAT